MIYKFKSKASGDVIMLGATGDRVLGLIGKPAAATGIIEPVAMPQAMADLTAAVEADDALRAQAGKAADEPGSAPLEAISLRQRAWPLVEMMKRCEAANEPIVWGV